ncbi:hypothetical protein NDU88_004010 [Pleurodeles waltl]|uniref:Uncharacterized protein n=1 Tax=Pleurodeles waltl TaxID=8319 RepID=A0AAV7M6N2_PLEWA|nr:hypothetical protein NDU88_004010 [Pleurodeles waltl]
MGRAARTLPGASAASRGKPVLVCTQTGWLCVPPLLCAPLKCPGTSCRGPQHVLLEDARGAASESRPHWSSSSEGWRKLLQPLPE